jgi:3-isopropylmalate/(R)-2-methylmalate dehydratase small subunit
MTEQQFVFKGKAFVVADDIDTDAILPAMYLNLTDEAEIASHCMEEIAPGFSARVGNGDILVAGDNFGCGSSREHAPVAIRGCGISCVIAKSFSRLFYRNAINIGLPALTADVASYVAEGDEISVDCLKGRIVLARANKTFSCAPFPPFMLELLHSGGLIGWLEKRLLAEDRLPATPLSPF